MQAYRSRWLRLGEAKAQLMAAGSSAEDAERQIGNMVRDGVLPGSDREGPRIRLNHDDNPLVFYAGPRADPWGWLRADPKLDFDRSAILRPVRCQAPPAWSATQETLRMMHLAMTPSAVAEEWTWEWTPIEILDELPSQDHSADSRPESPNEMPGLSEKRPDNNAAETMAYVLAVEEELKRCGMTTGYRRIHRALASRFPWATRDGDCKNAVEDLRGPQSKGAPKKARK
jgi:hypothetical protein